MALLYRYIFTRTLLGLAAASFILILLDFTFAALLELASLTGDYGVWESLTYLFTLIPSRVFLILPYATLFGVGWVVSQMADRKELHAMRACGMRKSRFLVCCTAAVCLYAALGLALVEWVIPNTLRSAEVQRDALRYADVQERPSGNAHWLRDGNTYMRIGSWATSDELTDIYTLRFDGSQLVHTLYAEQGWYDNGGWMLINAREHFVSPEHEGARVHEHPTLRIDSNITPDIVGDAARPEQMSLSRLYRHTQYRQANQVIADDYALTFWRQVSLPLTLFVMSTLAIALMFRPGRVSSHMRRLFLGIGLGLGIGVLQDLAGLFSLAYALSPFDVVAGYTLVLIFISLLLLRRS